MSVSVQEIESTEEALELYRDMFQELAPQIKRLKELEKQIKISILESGEVVNVDGVKVGFRKGYTRSTWDNARLQGYAVAHPEILIFATKKEVKPTVTISIK
jgi:hypothetical protein